MRYATIGGQAVIEGVMMRNGNDYAVAVRKPDQTIEVKKDQFIGLNARWHTKKIPIIRGVLSFIDSLVLGMSTLTYSASFFEDEEEAEKEKDKDGKSDGQCCGAVFAGRLFEWLLACWIIAGGALYSDTLSVVGDDCPGYFVNGDRKKAFISICHQWLFDVHWLWCHRGYSGHYVYGS